jgi:hypothetical protein
MPTKHNTKTQTTTRRTNATKFDWQSANGADLQFRRGDVIVVTGEVNKCVCSFEQSLFPSFRLASLDSMKLGFYLIIAIGCLGVLQTPPVRICGFFF